MSCIFCKIVAGEIPCHKVAESEDYLAFLDINPIQKGHTLVIPKKHVEHFLAAEDQLLHGLLPFARHVAQGVIKGVEAQGFHILANTHPAAGQVVFHLHFHIIPRFEGDGLRLWKGTPYKEGEAEALLAKIHEALTL